jgi:nucleotide-binding universal stress UspA family protein
MFTRLLVPLDRSSLAEQALGRAAAIARASHAEIELFMVHEPLPLVEFGGTPWDGTTFADDERYLETIAHELADGSIVSVGHSVVRGVPADAICERARAVGADLVVMTSHGRTGLSRAWIGSVADAVVRRSGIPVLMLRPIEGAPGRRAAHHLFKKILVPVDGSATALAVLPAAAALARCSDAHVVLVRVVEPVPVVPIDSDMGIGYSAMVPDREATRRLVDDATAHLAAVGRSFGEMEKLVVETQVVVNNVARGILDFAAAHEVDAIAMTTHGRGVTRLLLGSIADKILRAGGLPVMLKRPVDASDDVTELASEPEALTVPTVAPA